jgi:hypothetical protein
MRILFPILILFYFGCSNPFTELEEHSGMFEYKYYIQQGWTKFVENEFEDAMELFSMSLNTDTNQYLNSAYVGLAWSSLYQANSLLSSDSELMNTFREDSETYFDKSAIDTSEALAEYGENSFQFDKDLIVGRSYYYSLMSFITDESEYLDSIILKTDSIIELDPDYAFINGDKLSDTLYSQINIDSYLTIDDIYILRAQTFIKQGDFESANSALKELLIPGCTDLNDDDHQEIINCIASF